MSLTTSCHDGTYNSAGAQLQVECTNMSYRMQLCPLSTGINYRSPTEDFQYTERIVLHMTQWNSLFRVILRNTTVPSTALSPQILTFGVFPDIKTVLRIQREDFNLLNLFTYLLMRSIFNNALSQNMLLIIIIIIIIIIKCGEERFHRICSYTF